MLHGPDGITLVISYDLAHGMLWPKYGGPKQLLQQNGACIFHGIYEVYAVLYATVKWDKVVKGHHRLLPPITVSLGPWLGRPLAHLALPQYTRRKKRRQHPTKKNVEKKRGHLTPQTTAQSTDHIHLAIDKQCIMNLLLHGPTVQIISWEKRQK